MLDSLTLRSLPAKRSPSEPQMQFTPQRLWFGHAGRARTGGGWFGQAVMARISSDGPDRLLWPGQAVVVRIGSDGPGRQ